MFSPIASGIFAIRNADKTQGGDIGRGAVTVGQTAGLVQEVAKSESIFSGMAKSALSGISALAKEYKAVDYAGKAVNFAASNVNPLICVSGAVKTAMSDNKIETGVTEISALSAMFAGEGLIKLYYDNVANSSKVKAGMEKLADKKYIKPVFEYVEKHKLGGKVGAITKGLIFVGGSMASYAIGQKLGEDTAKRISANFT